MQKKRSRCLSVLLTVAVVLAGRARGAAEAVDDRGGVHSCVPVAGTALTVSINLKAAGDVGGVHLRLRYPGDRVDLPGGGQAPADRFSRSGSSLLVVNDHDGGVDVVAANTAPFSKTPFTVVSFDRCQGAAEATSDQFECTVLDASDPKGEGMSDVSCAATVP